MLIAVLCAVALVGVANATDETHVFISDTYDFTPPTESFYCQDPDASGWLTFNASTPFESASADDIPDALAGQLMDEVYFYGCQWGGTSPNFEAVNLGIHFAECPPNVGPADLMYTVAFADLSPEVVYDDGSQIVWFCKAMIPELEIQADMSLEFQLVMPWGQTTPYGGVVVTAEGDIHGDCDGYWAGDHWGYPRWTHFAVYGYLRDVAYCVGYSGGSAADPTTWGTIKSLYQ
jgi:hypothetical protein